ncbi:hypothetical protein FGB62_56g114 [Gracilaria domingensis]|nr:hypothetical protein FGB62_56g114 [Gracilaria domingensis]
MDRRCAARERAAVAPRRHQLTERAPQHRIAPLHVPRALGAGARAAGAARTRWAKPRCAAPRAGDKPLRPNGRGDTPLLILPQHCTAAPQMRTALRRAPTDRLLLDEYSKSLRRGCGVSFRLSQSRTQCAKHGRWEFALHGVLQVMSDYTQKAICSQPPA